MVCADTASQDREKLCGHPMLGSTVSTLKENPVEGNFDRWHRLGSKKTRASESQFSKLRPPGLRHQTITSLFDELFADSDAEKDDIVSIASKKCCTFRKDSPAAQIRTSEDDRFAVLDSDIEEESEDAFDPWGSRYLSDEEDSGDDDGSGSRRCKKPRLGSRGTKEAGLRKALPSQTEVRRAEELDPTWSILATLSHFLQHPNSNIAKAVQAHLQPCEMIPPYDQAQMLAIQTQAARFLPKLKREERHPKPYKKVRRIIFHESMKGQADIFKDDSHEHQCQCLSKEEAAMLPPHELENRGVSCDEHCLNRSLNVECSDGTCRFAASGECKNQRIGRKQQAAFRTFKTEGRGWGVQSVEDVEAGTLVSEYVGEAIDDEEVARRLWLAKQEEGEDADFYMVEAMGTTVDARYYGNESRFLNHSCDPNCRLEKWNVGGSYRLGIFAIKDIPAGTEYCWDYQFANFEGARPKRCRCGAVNCRKVLAGKAYRDEAGGEGDSQAPVSDRLEKLQRTFSGVQAFRAMLGNKPLENFGSLVLFFNGRTAPEEMHQAQKSRLWLTYDGPGVVTRERKRAQRAREQKGETVLVSARSNSCTTLLNVTEALNVDARAAKGTRQAHIALLPCKALQTRLESMLTVHLDERETGCESRSSSTVTETTSASSMTRKEDRKLTKGEANGIGRDLDKHAWPPAKVLIELTDLDLRRSREKSTAVIRRKYRLRRFGLLSLREMRWREAAALPFAVKRVGAARVQRWHESRWQAVSDMLAFMRQSESKGLWGDMSEDICYSCGCSGDLVCCDACTSAFHLSCAGLYEVPSDDTWFCTRCKRKVGSVSRRA